MHSLRYRDLSNSETRLNRLRSRWTADTAICGTAFARYRDTEKRNSTHGIILVCTYSPSVLSSRRSLSIVLGLVRFTMLIELGLV
jgi:hypothetical protein